MIESDVGFLINFDCIHMATCNICLRVTADMANVKGFCNSLFELWVACFSETKHAGGGGIAYFDQLRKRAIFMGKA